MSFKTFFEAAKTDAEEALAHIEGLVEADAHKALVDLHAALYGTLDRIEAELKKVPGLPASILTDLTFKVDSILAEVEELITGTHPAAAVPEPAAPVEATVSEPGAVDPPSSLEPVAPPADPVAIPGVTDTPINPVLAAA